MVDTFSKMFKHLVPICPLSKARSNAQFIYIFKNDTLNYKNILFRGYDSKIVSHIRRILRKSRFYEMHIYRNKKPNHRPSFHPKSKLQNNYRASFL